MGLIGLPLQNTARADPPIAMNTTLTADGTATKGSAKCFYASRNPRAADCIPVSIDTVRAVFSGKPTPFDKKYPMANAATCIIPTGMDKSKPFDRRTSATW